MSLQMITISDKSAIPFKQNNHGICISRVQKRLLEQNAKISYINQHNHRE